MLNSKIIKKAWQIRKAAAAKFNCKVMEISFKICIEMAQNGEKVVIMSNLTEKQQIRIVDLITEQTGCTEEMANKFLAKHIALPSIQKQAKEIDGEMRFNGGTRTSILVAVRNKIEKKLGNVKPKLKVVRSKTLILAADRSKYKHTGKSWFSVNGDFINEYVCYAYPRAAKIAQETITHTELKSIIENWMDDMCMYDDDTRKEGWNRATDYGRIKVID